MKDLRKLQNGITVKIKKIKNKLLVKLPFQIFYKINYNKNFLKKKFQNKFILIKDSMKKNKIS